MSELPIPCHSIQQMAGEFVNPSEEVGEISKEPELLRLI